MNSDEYNQDPRRQTPGAKPYKFGQLKESGPSHTSSSIELLRDVNLTISAELGRNKMVVKDILKLGVGSVVPLEKEAGEAVDVLVNNKVIARGEVVEIDGNYGIRITEIYG